MICFCDLQVSWISREKVINNYRLFLVGSLVCVNGRRELGVITSNGSKSGLIVQYVNTMAIEVVSLQDIDTSMKDKHLMKTFFGVGNTGDDYI